MLFSEVASVSEVRMKFWQALVIALIPTLGVLVGIWQATRDLGLRRKMDSTDRFLKIAATAHGRPADGRDRVGIAEQCAAFELLTEFGNGDTHLREPARVALQQTQSWATAGSPQIVDLAIVKQAANRALKRLKP